MATSTPKLSREELVGLLLAGTAHVALALVLILHQPEPKPYTPPERITVSLAEEVALDTTAPDPSPEPAAAMAPELAPLPEPPAAAPPPPPPPPQVRPTSRPTPTPTARPTTRPTTRPTARPTTRPTARPTPAPTASRSARPNPAPSAAPSARSSARATPAPTAAAGGASRINENFLDGASDATGDRGQAGVRASPQQQASIASAINRQLRPHWSPPTGVDVDRLVSVVRFRLNRDGTLDGSPELVRQIGINDNNRLQAPRHAEQAVRAVRLAAARGFDLPVQLYSEWDLLTINFDNRLAQ